MYRGIVEHGDKVAVLMDRDDLPLLVFLLGKQYGADSRKTKLLHGAYGALMDLLGEPFLNTSYELHHKGKNEPGWSIEKKEDS